MRRRFYADLAERTIWTFVQAFAAEWLVSSTFDRRSLMVGLAAGAIAVVKGLAATQVGSPFSASTAPGVGPPG